MKLALFAFAAAASSTAASAQTPPEIPSVISPIQVQSDGNGVNLSTGRMTDPTALAGIHRNWRAMLQRGLEAGDLPEDEAAAIEAHIRTGRPRGGDAFVEKLEAQTRRRLKRQKRGPKSKSKAAVS